MGCGPVPVTVTIDDGGPYWGWLDGRGTYPEFIFHRRMLVNMCFTYGPQAEVGAGRGRIVRLTVTETP